MSAACCRSGQDESSWAGARFAHPLRSLPPGRAAGALDLAVLLFPLLAALLHARDEILLVLVEPRRELVAEAVDRPRRALLHECEDLVDLLLLAGNRRHAAVAIHDRLVRLAGGNEVHAVLGDLLVRPQHVLKAIDVEREEVQTDQILAATAPAGSAREERELQSLL